MGKRSRTDCEVSDFFQVQTPCEETRAVAANAGNSVRGIDAALTCASLVSCRCETCTHLCCVRSTSRLRHLDASSGKMTDLCVLVSYFRPRLILLLLNHFAANQREIFRFRRAPSSVHLPGSDHRGQAAITESLPCGDARRRSLIES